MRIPPIWAVFVAIGLTAGAAVADAPAYRIGAGGAITERDDSAINLWLHYQRAPLTAYDPQLVHLGTSRAALAEGQTNYARFLRWNPVVDIRTGTDDVMGGYLLDLHADFEFMPWSYPADGGPAGQPDADRSRHTIPLAIGLEADRNFNSLGVIGTLGWRPVAAANASNLRLGVNPIFELAIQGGYKVGLDDTARPAGARGGDLDESLEPQDSWIGRLTGSLDGSFILSPGKRPLTWDYTLAGWYDFVNGDVYHQLSTEIRLPFASLGHGDDCVFTWDIFRYENGSGRPAFNEGQQFTTGVSAVF